MKKIINGKKYDTETATVIAEDWNGLGNRDWKYQCEVLYRKKTGEFFLHGEGGPLSKYGFSISSEVYSNSVILPLTEDDAREWLAEHANGDKYEEVFGAVEE